MSAKSEVVEREEKKEKKAGSSATARLQHKKQGVIACMQAGDRR
jgi:hypothetical protein